MKSFLCLIIILLLEWVSEEGEGEEEEDGIYTQHELNS